VKGGQESAGWAAEEIPHLLRVHARTMELSVRLLPRSLREPLGLAYLLARASDTIADSGRMASGERAARLEEIQAALAATPLWELRPMNFSGEFSPAEQGLLNALPGLVALLAESPDREELAGLWREILEGQLFDLRRFTPGSKPLDCAELERYCDLVAGSVGRCWTRLIARHVPGTLRVPLQELLPLASDYGRGLQLLNVLRDREADRAMGRHYVAGENVAAYLTQAREWLAAGERYLRAVAPGRILMASALPLDLAKATLPLIAAASAGTRAKLSRPAVRRAIAAGVLSLVLPRRADPV
jgi:farnesyl-diphosphate farnesyltransferase